MGENVVVGKGTTVAVAWTSHAHERDLDTDLVATDRSTTSYVETSTQQVLFQSLAIAPLYFSARSWSVHVVGDERCVQSRYRHLELI